MSFTEKNAATLRPCGGAASYSRADAHGASFHQGRIPAMLLNAVTRVRVLDSPAYGFCCVGYL